MSTILVNDRAQLASALQAAHAGDTISLAGGNYGDVLIKNKAFASDVTITSQNATSPATLHSLTILGSSHIHVDDVNVNFVPTATTVSFSTAVLITGSTSITLSHGAITGGNAINGVAQTAGRLDSTGNVRGLPTGDGVSIQKSSGVTVDHMNISHLNAGLGMGSSDHITITNNDIHDLRRTAIAGGSVSDVTIDSNHLHDSHPWRWGQTPVGDHADFIAFWTDPTTQSTASDNIKVSNNLMEQGKGTAILGMWFQGQYGNLGFTNVTVENNTILNGNFQGITLKGVDGAKVDHNTLLQTSGDAKSAPSILLNANVQHAQISDNITSAVNDLSGTTGSAANVIGVNKIVQDNNSSAAGYYTDALSAKLAVLTNFSGIYSQALGAVTTGPSLAEIQVAAQKAAAAAAAAVVYVNGTTGADVLTGIGLGGVDSLSGGAGNDTIISGRGADTMAGGAGADVFKFTPYSGKDVITDFGVGGHDVLDISALKLANLKPGLHDVGNDVQISFATGDVITLVGVHSKDLIATATGFTI